MEWSSSANVKTTLYLFSTHPYQTKRKFKGFSTKICTITPLAQYKCIYKITMRLYLGGILRPLSSCLSSAACFDSWRTSPSHCCTCRVCDTESAAWSSATDRDTCTQQTQHHNDNQCLLLENSEFTQLSYLFSSFPCNTMPASRLNCGNLTINTKMYRINKMLYIISD